MLHYRLASSADKGACIRLKSFALTANPLINNLAYVVALPDSSKQGEHLITDARKFMSKPQSVLH